MWCRTQKCGVSSLRWLAGTKSLPRARRQLPQTENGKATVACGLAKGGPRFGRICCSKSSASPSGSRGHIEQLRGGAASLAQSRRPRVSGPRARQEGGLCAERHNHPNTGEKDDGSTRGSSGRVPPFGLEKLTFSATLARRGLSSTVPLDCRRVAFAGRDGPLA